MRTEGDFIKIHEWLTPLSWLYGLGVGFRNLLFKLGILKSRAFDIPVISVGNITVGGSGKTPHVEYLVSLLKDKMKVAVLSRGYKRKSKGYVLANDDTTMREIGDEPYQMKQKFPELYVAVDKKRTEGIDRLTHDEQTKDVDVILLDDAYQHRYVKPGVNILLVDYHRLIIYDKLLPAGCLREPKEGKSRADIVIITKCPKDLRPMEYRVLMKALDLYPYQSLYFTTLIYDNLKQVYGTESMPINSLPNRCNVLLLTGIASPKQMQNDLSVYNYNLSYLSFSDHHNFSKKDIRTINRKFAELPSPKVIITTEKDVARIKFVEGLNDEVKESMYALPVRIQFMLGQEEDFNNKIINYVRKNSRNSILVKTKDDNKSQNSNNTRNGAGSISFRNN
ncbi:MAG: tetraacyldisaccharide 4'-kinase [Prevotella shahii]|uniref:tetraacyldisaccharide 4'-kinase n=1 Tax=Hoylesella shahii TaxID=228603 RepID=UPI001CB210EE|nr:tetraacyldisaccharide 4'-kinase [Hoylesella shahii]MBF1568199.1 tetraacyldisaccharide 4'-kinase [Hoylesella shahii]MBF1576460.1 tetraacyldisaccharide 4'-kinase [Hoylesella shahii]